MRQLSEAKRAELREQMAEYHMRTAEEATRSSQEDMNTGGTFKYERLGIQKGVFGGLIMMAIAFIWFFGALSIGLIFPYAPILFLIGLYAFIKGIVTGNFNGGAKSE